MTIKKNETFQINYKDHLDYLENPMTKDEYKKINRILSANAKIDKKTIIAITIIFFLCMTLGIFFLIYSDFVEIYLKGGLFPIENPSKIKIIHTTIKFSFFVFLFSVVVSLSSILFFNSYIFKTTYLKIFVGEESILLNEHSMKEAFDKDFFHIGENSNIRKSLKKIKSEGRPLTNIDLTIMDEYIYNEREKTA